MGDNQNTERFIESWNDVSVSASKDLKNAAIVLDPSMVRIK